MKKLVFVIAMIAVVGLVYAADEPKSEVGVTPIGVGHHHSQPVERESVDGAAWIIYDDGSVEDYYAGSGAAGNVFVETNMSWASFYCDGLSAYMDYAGSIWMTGHAGLNTAGTALTGYTDDLLSNTGTATGWVSWGATTTGGFFNNPTFTWQDTAYIAAYNTDDLGLDTNGPGSAGFTVGSYTGTGFVDEAFNAMLRARFNGPGVPVELMGFTVE